MKIIYLAFIIFLFPDLVLSEKNSRVEIYIAQEIVTLEQNYPIASAVAVEDARKKPVGQVDEIVKQFPKAQINQAYSDDVLVPGLIEHHVHPNLAAITMLSEVIAIEDWELPLNRSKGVRDRKSYLGRLEFAAQNSADLSKPLVTWGFHHYFHGCLLYTSPSPRD